MAIPIIASILGAILGRDKDGGSEMYTEPSYHENAQEGVRRAWDDKQRKYVDMGTVGDLVQPGQMRQYDEGTGMYGDAHQQSGGGGGFQGAMGKAGTIMSLLQSLRGNRQQPRPYQMNQIGRR